jgi:hypothetical protein
MRFEAPEMVEVLASPEEDEGRADLLLVSTRDGGVHALEQTPAAIQIPYVRRGDRCVVDECVTERDIPGTHRVGLSVEILAIPRQARVAVHHVPERRQGLSGAPHTRGAGDQRSDALDAPFPRRALGEILAERVVELVDGRVRKLPLVV